MSFSESVRTCFNKYADFNGRARRSEYWYFSLFQTVLDIILGKIFPNAGPVYYLISLALFIPGLSVGVRRLHDIGRSGWYCLISLIPVVGWILIIVWMVQDSQQGTNQYGPSPKYPEAEFTVVSEPAAQAAPVAEEPVQRPSDLSQEHYTDEIIACVEGERTAAKFCSYCGTALKPGQKFCENCGAKVEG